MTRKDIICFTMTTWEGDYMKTIVHMMGHLAKTHRVLFVDYPFTVKDLAFSIIGKSPAPAKRMLGISPRLREVSYQGNIVHHLTLPPVLPTNWIKDENQFDGQIQKEARKIEKSVKKAMVQIGMFNPVVINAFNPIIGLPLAGKFEEESLIYYCYDEISAASWCKVHGARMEQKFLKKVDAVITTSVGLEESKKLINPNTFLVKNGVDVDLFSRAFNEDTQNEKPVIGYIGSVDARLDYDLLESTVQRLPDYDFHFVGRITYPEGQQLLSLHSNVKFFGGQSPEKLPDYLAQFDVGIIPFVKDEFTRNIYPLKINEYLAAGKPVVTTDFANLEDFLGIVEVADSAEAFYHAIQVGHLSNSVDKMESRAVVASQNSWESRVKQVQEIIDSLSKKPVNV